MWQKEPTPSHRSDCQSIALVNFLLSQCLVTLRSCFIAFRSTIKLRGRLACSGLISVGTGNDREGALVNVLRLAGVVVLKVDAILSDVLVLAIVPDRSGSLLDGAGDVAGVVEVVLVTAHLPKKVSLIACRRQVTKAHLPRSSKALVVARLETPPSSSVGDTACDRPSGWRRILAWSEFPLSSSWAFQLW